MPTPPAAPLTRSLFWKEMRQLRQVLLAVLACQIVCYVGLFAIGFLDRASILDDRRIPIEVFLGGAVAMAGLLGSLFFSTELDSGAGTFLFRLPISRWQILRAKALAALSTFGLAALVSAILALAAILLWTPVAHTLMLGHGTPGTLRIYMPYGTRFVHGYIVVALAFYCVAAYLSLRITNTVGVFLLSAVFLTAFLILSIRAVQVLVNLCNGPNTNPPQVTPNWFLSASIVLTLLSAAGAWLALRGMEERPTPGESRIARVFSALRISEFVPNTLQRVDARQKRFLMIVVFVFSVAGMLLLGTADAQWFIPVLAGLVSGVTMFTSRERDGVGFFLHYLPIPRRALFRQRIAMGLLIGFVPVLAFLAAVTFLYVYSVYSNQYGAYHTPFGDVGSAAQIAGLVYGSYAIAFLTGAIFSPLVRSDLTGIFYAALAILCYIWFGNAVSSHPIVWPGLPCLVFLYLIARWMTARSRAFEPGIRRDGRALFLVAAIWCLGVAVSLVNPVDIIYLMTGLDLTGLPLQ